MSRVLVAGVDTSTQSTKVRVTDAETGEMVRFGQAKHPDGTSVNPDAWWQAFQEAAEQAGGLDDVAALAVGGQQHGMVLLDDHGRVIRDALLWNDTRSATNADVLIACLGEAEKAADGSEDDLSDDPAMRGRQRWVKAVGSSLVASLTITKVAWVAANEPENAARIAAICLPHDWLSWRIAGHGPLGEDATAEEMKANLDALFTDRSDASGTAYFDATANEYRRDLLAMALGRGEEDIAGIVLPRVLGPTETGDVADPAIAGKDVEGGCPIGPGGGDNAMASLGLSMGVGDVSISLGTSGVAAAISPVPAYDMTASVTGFADCTGHWLPLATAALYGMTLANTRRENIARAFVEGLLCSQRDCLELVKGLGVDVKRILLIGGGTKFAAVRALAPAILGMDVELPETDEYVAIGAARQAAWVLSGETEPPTWPVKVETTLTGEPTPQVYEQYVRWRG